MTKQQTSHDKLVFPYPKGDDFFDDGLPKGVLSPSGFNTYRRCARQFYYAYVKREIKAPAIAMVKGTAIHKGAEVVHNHTIKYGKPLKMEAGVQAVSDAFDAEKEAVEDATDIEKGNIKDAAIRNFQVYYRDAVPLIHPVAAEKPFAMKIGTVPFRGVIDLIDKIPGEYSLDDDPDLPPPKIEVVSDLKTTTKMWTEQKLNEEPQLTFYAIVENTNRVRIDFLLDQKKGCKYAPKRTLRDTTSKKILIEDVEEAAHNMKRGCFPRCDPTQWVCTPRFCGYYADCKGPK